MGLRTESPVLLHASDRDLEIGFDRIKRQALRWVFEGYPVGDYYEAALPNRDAFCMRDVSHQCTGGEVLGLSRHNFNMFTKFAEGISEKRDWCSFWEIDRFDRPCPVDYASDCDFWYNLPANFDVLDACWRMFQWTGDLRYLKDPRLDYFFAQTMEAYIARWDRDGDGLPDRDPAEGRRGLASYDESDEMWRPLKVGTDLILLLAKARLSYSKMCAVLGRREQAAIYRKRAQTCIDLVENRLYDPAKGYAVGLDQKLEPLFAAGEWNPIAGLYYGLTDPARAQPVLDAVVKSMEQMNIEGFSHVPEILWRWNRPEDAMRAMRRSMDPNLPRKEYPEASFCAVGAVATGMFGIRPSAQNGVIRTKNGMRNVSWARLSHVPVLGGFVSVEHEGDRTAFLNEGGAPVQWIPEFAGSDEARAYTVNPGEERSVQTHSSGLSE